MLGGERGAHDMKDSTRGGANPAAAGAWNEAAVEAAVIERCSGVVPLAGRLLRAFVQQTAEDVAAIEAAAGAGDAVAMDRAAHRLKGASASLGLETCRAAATEILTLARAGRTDGASPHVSVVRGEAARIAEMRLAREAVADASRPGRSGA